MTIYLPTTVALATVLSFATAAHGNPMLEASDPAPGQPRLVLQITVDQLRGDMLKRLIGDRFVDGGFQYLL